MRVIRHIPSWHNRVKLHNKNLSSVYVVRIKNKILIIINLNTINFRNTRHFC